MNKASPSVRARWRQIIEQQKSSGLPVAQFCRENQIGPSSLFAWKRRLAREGEGAGGAFVRVEAASALQPDSGMDNSGGGIELHLGQGRHLLLRPGFDARTLAAVLAVLAGETPRPEQR